MTTEKFNELKQEITARAQKDDVTKNVGREAIKAKTMTELCNSIKRDFTWFCCFEIIDVSLIRRYEADFKAESIFANRDTSFGYVLAVNADIIIRFDSVAVAFGSTNVTAYETSTVTAYNGAEVGANDNSMVIAWDNTTVNAFGNATVTAYNDAEVNAYEFSKVTAYGHPTIDAYNNAMVIVSDGGTSVTAKNYASVISSEPIKCDLMDNAKCRIISTNEIRYASEGLRFIKQ